MSSVGVVGDGSVGVHVSEFSSLHSKPSSGLVLLRGRRMLWDEDCILCYQKWVVCTQRQLHAVLAQ